ncbi:MAG TPA: SGNH/GDSL hydrolase family protein [Candidatus Dormibacteraeota bacterium]|nr:SGNH/GDSL hydrolase family protein [Candidatus Dormibacteraeota bacterium]
MRLRLAAISVALLAVVAGAMPAAASSNQQTEPGKYYLSLGDSLAFGFQQATFNRIYPNERPDAFHTGYTNDFARLLKSARPGIKTVNYGCPGETTVSFINGPCPYPFALHNAYTQPSQLATALAFLGSHPNRVSPITIDLGSNDATHDLIEACPDPNTFVACVTARLPALLNKVGTNLATIVATLHAASPTSEIIVLDLYNPLAVSIPASDQFATFIDNTIKLAATSQGARVADVFPVFNPSGPAEVPTLCLLTAICTSLHDTHPTNAGYAAMALTLWQASGYTREDDD